MLLPSRREVRVPVRNDARSERRKICRQRFSAFFRKEKDLLFLALIEQYKILFRQIAYRFALLVMDHDIHLHQPCRHPDNGRLQISLLFLDRLGCLRGDGLHLNEIEGKDNGPERFLHEGLLRAASYYRRATMGLVGRVAYCSFPNKDTFRKRDDAKPCWNRLLIKRKK